MPLASPPAAASSNNNPPAPAPAPASTSTAITTTTTPPQAPAPSAFLDALTICHENKMLPIESKKRLLRVSKNVRQITLYAITSLRGKGTEVLPILARFPHVQTITLSFTKEGLDGNFGKRILPEIDLSVVAPFLQMISVTVTNFSKEKKKNKNKKKTAKKKKQQEEEVVVVDEDTSVAAPMVVVNEEAEQQGEGGGCGGGCGGGSAARKKTPAKKKGTVAGEEEEVKGGEGGGGGSGEGHQPSEESVVVQNPFELLYSMRSLRFLKGFAVKFRLDLNVLDKFSAPGYGGLDEAFAGFYTLVEEHLPSSLERFDFLKDYYGLNLMGMEALTRAITRQRLPRLECLKLREQDSDPRLLELDEDGIATFFLFLSSLTRYNTPRLRELILSHRYVPSVRKGEVRVDEEGQFVGYRDWPCLKLLLQQRAVDLEAAGVVPLSPLVAGVKRWWCEERPEGFETFITGISWEFDIAPSFLTSPDEEMVALGTLLCASGGYSGHPDWNLTSREMEGMIGQLESHRPLYNQAQAARGLYEYAGRGGEMLWEAGDATFVHRMREHLFALTNNLLTCDRNTRNCVYDRAAHDFATHTVLEILLYQAHTGEKRYFRTDEQLEAALGLAVKVVAFHHTQSTYAYAEDSYRNAAYSMLKLLSRSADMRTFWVPNSLGAIAQRGLEAEAAAAAEEGGSGQYGSGGGGGGGNSMTVTSGPHDPVLHIIRLVMRLEGAPRSAGMEAPSTLVPKLLFRFLTDDLRNLAEALRTHRLLAPIISIFLRSGRPYLLGFCLDLEQSPTWLPGFMVDVLLRREPAPSFRGFGKILTSLLGVSQRVLEPFFPEVTREEIERGKNWLIENMLVGDRLDWFWRALAADAKGMGAVTLLGLLKEVAQRELLATMGGEEKMLLAEACDMMKLATDPSPGAAAVLVALCGDPAERLVKVAAAFLTTTYTRTGKLKGLKGKMMDDLLVALADLTPASLTTGKEVLVSGALDEVVKHLGREELLERLQNIFESMKIKRKMSMTGTYGRQMWALPRLRVFAAAMSSFTRFSPAFVSLLAEPGRVSKAVVALPLGEIMNEAGEVVEGSEYGPVIRDLYAQAEPALKFLEVWVEALAGVPQVPTLAVGLARACVQDQDMLRALILEANKPGANIGRLAKGLALLTLTSTMLVSTSAVAGGGGGGGGERRESGGGGEGEGGQQQEGGGDGGGGGGGQEEEGEEGEGGGGGSGGGEEEEEEKEEGDDESRGGGTSAADGGFVYNAKCVGFGIPVLDPAAVVAGLTDKNTMEFTIVGRLPFLTITLAFLPAFVPVLRNNPEKLVVMLINEYNRIGPNNSGFFNRHMHELLTRDISDDPSRALDELTKHVSIDLLLSMKAWRVLRVLVEARPQYCLPTILTNTEGGPVELSALVAEAIKIPAFALASVEGHLVELFDFLVRASKGSTNGLDLVVALLRVVPDLCERLKGLLLREEGGGGGGGTAASAGGAGGGGGEEEVATGGKLRTSIQRLVEMMTSDRRYCRGDNKVVIEQFQALLPPGEGGLVPEPTRAEAAAAAREERSNKRRKR